MKKLVLTLAVVISGLLLGTVQGYAQPGGNRTTQAEAGITNFHVHGLHVGGGVPSIDTATTYLGGDNIFIEIGEGESNFYRATVPNDHLRPRVVEVPRHGTPHVAEADESNLVSGQGFAHVRRTTVREPWPKGQ